MPQSAKAVPTMSLEKCSASAASASLFVAAAIRFSESQRTKSTSIEAIKTAKTMGSGSMLVSWLVSRETASIKI